MDSLSALIADLWKQLFDAAWFQYVQWPFWAFLTLLAFGGVYTARIKKNTLFCQGITGALKLTLIYLIVVSLYRRIPSYMNQVSEFPFLSVSDTTITLVNPLSLLDRPFTALPMSLVRLYCLLFIINLAGRIDYINKKFVTWGGIQVVTCASAAFLFSFVSYHIDRNWEKIFDSTYWLYLGSGILLLLPLAILLGMKLWFIVFRKSGNPTYSTVMQFFTTHKFGTLFSVTLFSMVVVLLYLVAISLCGISKLALANFNRTAYLLIIAMCLGTLWVYSLYYTEYTAG